MPSSFDTNPLSSSPLNTDTGSAIGTQSADPLSLPDYSTQGRSSSLFDESRFDEPLFDPFTSGYFTVGSSGQVSIDYVFDGGGYAGELAIFSLTGLETFEVGSTAFIQEIARRALSNSTEGHIVISDQTEGARFSGNLDWAGDFNAGEYQGVKTFSMRADDRFGVMLIPDGSVREIFYNPSLDGAKRPLFSLVMANPVAGFHVGQIADVDGNGSTFVMEDLRLDAAAPSDRDYNDIIFQIRGAIGSAVGLDEVIDVGRDWREKAIGQAVLEYAAGYDNPKTSIPSYSFPQANQPLIGIIDTGFAANNPDIDYSRITLGRDFVGNDNNPLLAAGEGSEHGTHILGIIGATQNNGIGIDGLNDQAPLWVGRAIGSGRWAESLVEFVNQALDSNQPNAVINLSLDLTQRNADGSVTTRYEFTPEERAALEYARQSGVLIVAAAGNDGGVMSALGQASQEFDNIITVGAANGQSRAEYSSYGYGLDILAPGGTNTSPAISTVGDGLGRMAGTSVATAHVTGAISQVWAANPGLSYRQVIDLIKSTATDLANPGWDSETGTGLLNEAAAIALAQATVGTTYTPTPWFSPATWSGEGTVQPLERAANGTNQPTAGQIPTNPGSFIRTEVSNGVTIHYYTDGYLIVQPGGFQRWYAIGNGLARFDTTITGTPIPSSRRSPQPDNGSQPENGVQGTTPRPDPVYFADVDGDGTDDAIVVNNSGTTVRFSNGRNRFLPNTDATTNPYFGAKRTYFTDVTGDGKADAIVVNNDGVYVRVSNGSSFENPVKWINVPYYGDKGTFFADVNDDGRADAIVVNSGRDPNIQGITVRLSSGNGFGTPQRWIDSPYHGDRGTFFADVNGDGKADAIVVNSGRDPSIQGVTVRLSTGNGFGTPQHWINIPYDGDKGNFFADVNGDGKADAIALNSEQRPNDGVIVRLANAAGNGFSPQDNWTDNAYYGDKGTYFADVNGDGKADAVVNNATGGPGIVGVIVRPSNGSDFLDNQSWTGVAYYGSGGHGSLVQAIGQPEVYLIEGNERRWIPNPETLAEIRQGRPIQRELSVEDLNGIPRGADIPSVPLSSNPGTLEPPLHSNPTPSNPLRGFRHPLLGSGSMTQGPNGTTSHSGRNQYAIDYGTPIGTPVYAMRSGRVVGFRDIYPDTGGDSSNAYRANYVVIEHDNGYRSAYLHLQQRFNSRVGLSFGDTVTAGQLIGYSGNSGWSTGPHLHVEVHKPYPDGTFGQTVPFVIG